MLPDQRRVLETWTKRREPTLEAGRGRCSETGSECLESRAHWSGSHWWRCLLEKLMARLGDCSGSETDGSLLEEWCAGWVRWESGGSWLENVEDHQRRSLKGGLSQRGPEVFRDALYAMFPALERHKNRGRTPCSTDEKVLSAGPTPNQGPPLISLCCELVHCRFINKYQLVWVIVL